MQKYAIVLAVLNVLACGLLSATPQAETKSSTPASLAAARDWIRQHKDTMKKDLSDDELSGAIELLHWLGEEKDNELIVKLSGHLMKKSEKSLIGEDSAAKEQWFRMALMQLLYRPDVRSLDYQKSAVNLMRLDKDNILPVLFVCEASWQHVDIVSLEKAFGEFHRREKASGYMDGMPLRVLAFLKRSGHDSAEARNAVLLLPLPRKTLNAHARHASLLREVPLAVRMYGWEMPSKPNDDIRYLLLAASAVPAGRALDVMALCYNLEKNLPERNPEVSKRIREGLEFYNREVNAVDAAIKAVGKNPANSEAVFHVMAKIRPKVKDPAGIRPYLQDITKWDRILGRVVKTPEAPKVPEKPRGRRNREAK